MMGPPGPILDAATVSWINAVYANGGTVSAVRRLIVDTLVTNLKSDGIFAKLDRLWLFAADNTASALTDLVGLTLATAVNAPTFAANRGYTGDQSTNYINTLFVPPGTNHTQNSASFGVWANTVGTSNTFQRHGWRDTGAITRTLISAHFALTGGSGLSTDAEYSVNIDPGGGSEIGFQAANPHFLVAGNRSAVNATKAYVDGNNVAAADGTGTSGGFTNAVAFYVLGQNTGGSLAQPSGEQISATFIGGNLTATEHALIFNRLKYYMVSIGN